MSINRVLYIHTSQVLGSEYPSSEYKSYITMYIIEMPRSRDPSAGNTKLLSPYLSPYLSGPDSSPTFAAPGEKDKAPEVQF